MVRIGQSRDALRRAGQHLGDDDLLAALDEMTSEAETFTRTLLGGGVRLPESEGAGEEG